MLTNHSPFSKTALFSALCATLMLTACNDSNASGAAAVTAVEAQDSTKLVTTASDIKDRNHVCFTMDVNNVKCVLGDTVAYVPQPILDEAPQNNSKDKKKTSAKEKEAQAQLLANQNALNEARSLVFVAKYCDMERPVVYSKEGVACTFKPHALYDAGAVAEATQYQMNLIDSEEFFKEVAAVEGVEKFTDPAFGTHGGYRIFLEHGAKKDGMKIGDNTSARILTKRIDRDGNVLGFYHEELNFENLNPQMKILTAGLVEGDHVKLVFDTNLQDEQPLWRTSSLEFGQPYIWEVSVRSVGPAIVEQPQNTEAATESKAKKQHLTKAQQILKQRLKGLTLGALFVLAGAKITGTSACQWYCLKRDWIEPQALFDSKQVCQQGSDC